MTPADTRKVNLMPFTIVESPVGPLTAVAGPAGVQRLYFADQVTAPEESDRYDPQRLAFLSEQLEQYFSGERRTFELRIELHGTPFQRRVWGALREIPYGTTTTYGELARRLGLVGSGGAPNARAVGAAVGATPVPIVIPCHRVIGADGSLTGYGGGLERKRALLDFEAAGGDPSAFDAVWVHQQLALM
jgi:methylated-DNA-[protein]-cysteine S-methyltransferase